MQKIRRLAPKSDLIPDDDLPELDEEDLIGEINAEDDADESDTLLNAVQYKECVLTVPFRRDLLDLSVTEISRFALEVVEAEGPIHTHEIARRIREAFGLQKTGKRILAHVKV